MAAAFSQQLHKVLYNTILTAVLLVLIKLIY